jgi:hypothetical protein
MAQRTPHSPASGNAGDHEGDEQRDYRQRLPATGKAQMTEEWRKIPSFPDYEASSTGRIRSRFRERKLSIDDDGYLIVGLYLGGEVTMRRVNTLVCEAFHGPKPPWAQVAAHNNGIRTANRPENLRWSTHLSNSADMVKHGTLVHGEKHPRALFEQSQVDAIRAQYRAKPDISTIRRLADVFMVSELTIRNIVTGRSWAASFKKEEADA